MANISIRNLENKIYRQLRLRAAKHGHSMEEEVRLIISQAVSVSEQITVIFQRNFGSKNGVDLKIPKRKPHSPMDFTE